MPGLWLVIEGTLFLVGLAVGHAFGPSQADTEFFSASAQIMPVLILALAIEQRFFRTRRIASTPPDVLGERGPTFVFWAEIAYRAGVFLLLLVGELGALHALMYADANVLSDPRVVLAPMIGAIAVIGVRAFRADVEHARPSSPPAPPAAPADDPAPRSDQKHRRARSQRRRRPRGQGGE